MQEKRLNQASFLPGFFTTLAANSEPLKVKMGTQGFGKIAK